MTNLTAVHPFVIYAVVSMALGGALGWAATKAFPSLPPSSRKLLWAVPLVAPFALYGGVQAAYGLGLVASCPPLAVPGSWAESHLATLCAIGTALARPLAPLFVLALLAGSLKAAVSLWLATRLDNGDRASRQRAGVQRVDAALRALESEFPALKTRLPRVVVSPRVPGGAFAAGLFRPVIALSESYLETLDDEELAAVLAHELAHVEAGDNWKKWLAVTVRDALVFTGLSFAVYRGFDQSMEEAADERAGAHRSLALAGGIIKACRFRGAGRVREAVLDNFAPSASASSVTARVRRLLDAAGGHTGPCRLAPARAPGAAAGFLVLAVIGLVSLSIC